MVEHLTQKQIEAYFRRELPSAELLSVTDHLSDCEICREATSGDAAFFELHSEIFDETDERGAHLTMEQTAAYVDRGLTGEELRMVDDHLTHCHECVMAVDDLRAFRNEIAPSLDREYAPAAAVPVSVPIKKGRPSMFERLFAPFRVSPAPAFAGVALAVVVLAVIGWIVWRSQQRPEPQIVEAPRPSPPEIRPPSLPESATTQPQPAPAEGQFVAQINDGAGVVALDQEGKLSGADHLPPAYQTLLKNALSSGRVERSSQLQGLTRQSSSLMGSGGDANAFHVVEPVGTVLLTDKPAFRWSAMPDATGYVVEVYDEAFNLVVSSPQLTALNWTTTLPRGNTYSWQVKATTGGETVTSPRPPAPQAKFRIVDQAKANEIAKARRAYASSHLTLGLLYAEAGLLREAEQEFRLLQKANPNSELARSLLRQIQTMRRQAA